MSLSRPNTGIMKVLFKRRIELSLVKNVYEFETSVRKYRLQSAEIYFPNRMVPINAPISQEDIGNFSLQKALTLIRVQHVFHPSRFFYHSRYATRS